MPIGHFCASVCCYVCWFKNWCFFLFKWSSLLCFLSIIKPLSDPGLQMLLPLCCPFLLLLSSLAVQKVVIRLMWSSSSIYSSVASAFMFCANVFTHIHEAEGSPCFLLWNRSWIMSEHLPPPNATLPLSLQSVLCFYSFNGWTLIYCCSWRLFRTHPCCSVFK